MNLFSSMSISATGMSAEQRRMEASAQNLSIVHVAARPGEALPFHRYVSVAERGTIPGEDPALQSLMSSNDGLSGVNAEEMAQAPRVRLQHDPNHPMADASGMVAYPDINYLEEMVGMMGAQRAFDANVTAYMEARNMLQKALEIGRT